MAEQLLRSKHSPQQIQSFLQDNLAGVGVDHWQPNLQMFESMISAFSQQQSQADNRNSREMTLESFVRPESRNELIESTKGGFNIKTNGQSSFFP